MKKLMIGLVALVLLASCDEDLLTFNVDTHLQKTITADVQDPELKNSAYAFEVVDTLSLDDNEAIQEYLTRIREINIKETSCQLSGIPANEKIIELTIETAQDGVLASLHDLSENGVSIDLNVATAVIDAISTRLLNEQTLIIKVSGKSTIAPMQLNVQLDFYTGILTSIND